jgi:hypothetical protein
MIGGDADATLAALVGGFVRRPRRDDQMVGSLVEHEFKAADVAPVDSIR